MSEPRTVSADDMAASVGREVGVSRWFKIDQARIDAFADVIEDWQFIHVDEARARAESPFGGTIAHGFLSVSLLSAMFYDAVPTVAGRTMGVNYGFDRLRFLAPVPCGSKVRGRFTLKSAEERRPGELTMVLDTIVEIDGEERPALAAEWLTRQYFDRPA